MGQYDFETKTGIWTPKPTLRSKAILHRTNYRLLRDAYYGIGGFADGTYLVKHKRESEEKYAQRRSLAYYLNYTASAVNSHVDPVFRDEVKRDWKGNDALFEAFLENTDMTGNSIQSVARRAALGSKLYGTNFVVVDNVAEQPEALEAAIKGRVCPYAYIVEPDRVVDYEIDRHGCLQMFSYKELKDGELTEYNVRTWTAKVWQLTSGTGGVIAQGEHNLGRVPVVVWQSRELDPADILPPSEFGSIAQTNLAIYQLCSWLTEILQNQAFSILIYPTTDDKNFTIGVNNALGFDPESRHPPAFVAPPADPAEMLQGQIDRLIQEIYRMANLTLVTGVQEAKSGVAKAWDFERTNQTLADFAANCEAAEKDIVELYKLWTGSKIEYLCEYPRDFAIVDVADELANAQAAVDLQFGTKMLAEVAKKVLAAYLPNLEPEVFDAIIKEIESKGTDALMSQTDGPVQAANAQELASTLQRLLQAQGAAGEKA